MREAVSAGHDGEPTGPAVAVDGHLARCEACRAFAADLPALDATVLAARAVPAAPGGAVLAAIGAAEAAVAARRVRDLRLLVALAGIVQFVLAVPALLGVDAAAAHLGRDLGAVQLALGVGLLLAAWQPRRTAGVLPVVGVAAGVALVAGGLDLVAGRTAPLQELSHLGEVVAVVALWALGRHVPASGFGASSPRSIAVRP